MKRILAVLFAVLLFACFAPRSALAFGVKDVVAMSQYGIPDSLIIAKIHHSGERFDLNAKDLIALRAAKVSDDVVVAMLRTEDENHEAIFYDGRYWPYDPNWYVGLDLGFYGPYWPGYYGRGYGFHGYGFHRFGRGRR